ncbi:MAG: DUF975 family protein [Clostridia bacterium]|nr:DUF975 family protein [Clostridia bacterium]
MLASDFRAAARGALSGRWTIAVIAGLIAAVLGGISSNLPKVNFNLDSAEGASVSLRGIPGLDVPILSGIVAAWLASFVMAAVILAIALYILGSVISLGYARFNLDLIDGREPELNVLFSDFHRFGTAFLARLLMSLYILLWSLLLIIPGIMAAYSYAMTPYILAENPDMTAGEAIARSKALMAGNRWRLFCLQFSFIGWNILAGLTLGIGNLWLTPYTQAAEAAFYRDLVPAPASDADILLF